MPVAHGLQHGLGQLNYPGNGPTVHPLEGELRGEVHAFVYASADAPRPAVFFTSDMEVEITYAVSPDAYDSELISC
jgi:hypothetical protein